MNSMPFKKREHPLVTPNTPVTNPSNTKRDKYTATMDRDLRKRAKIAAIERGIDFSQFIEEAVIEKLGRGGL